MPKAERIFKEGVIRRFYECVTECGAMEMKNESARQLLNNVKAISSGVSNDESVFEMELD